MRGGRFRQAFEVVAAFEHRDHAALRGLVGDLHDLAGGPAEVLLDELQIGERVALVRVEAGRDDDQFGAERGSRGRMRVSIAALNCSPPSPARSGALTMLSCSPRSVTAPVPG